MADVLYELEYSVNTTGLDKGEARLKRYDQAMESIDLCVSARR